MKKIAPLILILLTLTTAQMIERGDKYLQMSDSPVGILKEDQALYATKALAYYSRALLSLKGQNNSGQVGQ